MVLQSFLVPLCKIRAFIKFSIPHPFAVGQLINENTHE